MWKLQSGKGGLLYIDAIGLFLYGRSLRQSSNSVYPKFGAYMYQNTEKIKLKPELSSIFHLKL